jgi:hypothetical protein
MFVEREGDIGLEGQARAFEDDLGDEFGHVRIILRQLNRFIEGRLKEQLISWGA